MDEKKNSAVNSAPILVRLIKMLFSFYPVMLPVALACILFNAIISSIPSIFMQNVISLVEQSWQAGDKVLLLRVERGARYIVLSRMFEGV